MKLSEILAQVTAQKFPEGSYVVFGSGPLAALKIREVSDIDLLVSGSLYAQLRKSGWEQIYKGFKDKPLISGDLEVHSSWDFSSYNPTLDELLSRAFFIDGVPFASINDVYKWKVASGRPKDLNDIKLIGHYRATAG